ncbi:MAG: response regulator transcription factor [Vulcanimicrobiaceae bacterium]
MENKVTVLVADDEAGLVRLLKSELELAGYHVISAEDGTQAVELAAKREPDVIILDIMMPGKDGFAVCEEVREFSYSPIIMLSARGQQRDKVQALNIGADDYMTKPFGMEELLARVGAAVRRSRIAQGEIQRAPLRVGNITIDFGARQVRKGDKPVTLTTTEYKLLCALVKNPGRVVMHEALLSSVWGPEYTDQTEYLWVYVGRLRNRLEDDANQPKMILTVPGVGYRFDPSSAN